MVSKFNSKNRRQKTIHSIKTFFSSIPSLFCSKTTQTREVNPPVDTTLDTSASTVSKMSNTLDFFPPLDQESQSSSTCDNKDIIPLEQFSRYTITSAESRKFRLRRLLYPTRAIYEIEWEKGKWLQFDHSTNQYIEQLRTGGFSKAVVRNDASLKEHVSYDNPSELDALLEISFGSEKKSKQGSRTITCHQPTSFLIRRTRWWRTCYRIGEAHLPRWVDPDLCCSAVLMDPSSVMVIVKDYSRSFTLSKIVNTSGLSQHSPMLQLPSETYQTSPWQFKSLKYTHPPVLESNPDLPAR
ncbi:hypothetical protein G6F37_000379 [Rhizopus arrhizus]|nr:hypothetical protein G6F38_011052 [Rhizopus arrhizus]KAG1164321.1 hypothetical protein G6F37_000379 [Rhizopus arrhizus]